MNFQCIEGRQDNNMHHTWLWVEGAPYSGHNVSCPTQIWLAREDFDTLLAFFGKEMTLLILDRWYMTCQDHNQL